MNIPSSQFKIGKVSGLDALLPSALFRLFFLNQLPIDDLITIRVTRTEINEINVLAPRDATKIETKPIRKGDVRKIGAFLCRLKGLEHMGMCLVMGNDICSLREAHQAVDMVTVAVGESDGADRMRSQLLDFRNHIRVQISTQGSESRNDLRPPGRADTVFLLRNSITNNLYLAIRFYDLQLC